MAPVEHRHSREEDGLFERLLADRDRDDIVKLFDSALEKWMDKKLAMFGRWSIMGILSLAFAALIYFYVHTAGWSK